jgi:hypothetical protein
MSEYDIFCFILPENLPILTNSLLLFVWKGGERIKELIYAHLNSFGQNNRLRYGNNSYSWFTLTGKLHSTLKMCNVSRFLTRIVVLTIMLESNNI